MGLHNTIPSDDQRMRKAASETPICSLQSASCLCVYLHIPKCRKRDCVIRLCTCFAFNEVSRNNGNMYQFLPEVLIYQAPPVFTRRSKKGRRGNVAQNVVSPERISSTRLTISVRVASKTECIESTMKSLLSIMCLLALLLGSTADGTVRDPGQPFSKERLSHS